MSEKIFNKSTGKIGARKSGYNGDKMWHATRLEGVNKNRGIKPVRKKKKGF
jgi:hypothetical protein